MSLVVPLIRLPHAEGLPLPKRATDGAAGLDLMAALPQDGPITLQPMQRRAIPTGLCMEIPQGFEGQVRPRSGLAIKNGITVLNTPGTIDADYRGEVMVILINLSDEAFTVERGMRIAQMLFAPVTMADFVETATLSTTKRGEGGHGSTGR